MFQTLPGRPGGPRGAQRAPDKLKIYMLVSSLGATEFLEAKTVPRTSLGGCRPPDPPGRF